MEVVINFDIKVPSQSCFCTFLVLISLNDLSFFKMCFIILYNIVSLVFQDS